MMDLRKLGVGVALSAALLMSTASGCKVTVNDGRTGTSPTSTTTSATTTTPAPVGSGTLDSTPGTVVLLPNRDEDPDGTPADSDGPTTGDVDCDDYATRTDAQAVLAANGTTADPFVLDTDNDGQACETTQVRTETTTTYEDGSTKVTVTVSPSPTP